MSPPNSNSQDSLPPFLSYIFPSSKDEISKASLEQAQEQQANQEEPKDLEQVEAKKRETAGKQGAAAVDMASILWNEGYSNEIANIIKEGGVGITDQKPEGFWSKVGTSLAHGGNAVIRQLTRAERATFAGVGQMFEAAHNPDQSLNPISGQYWSELFKSLGDDWDAAKQGWALQERTSKVLKEETTDDQGNPIVAPAKVPIGSGVDLWSKVVGEENWQKFTDWAHNTSPILNHPEAQAQYKKDLDQKVEELNKFLIQGGGDPSIFGVAKQAVKNEFSVKGTAFDPEEIKALPGAVEDTANMAKYLSPTALTLGTEVYLDPLLRFNFGDIKNILTGTSSKIFKGIFSGLTKIPKMGPKIEESANTIQKGMEDINTWLSRKWGVIDPKFGATFEYSKVLGDDQKAGQIVEDAKNKIVEARSLATLKTKELNSLITPTEGESVLDQARNAFGSGALKRGFIRSTTKKLSDLLGYQPSNVVMKYLSGMDDRTTAMETISKALIQADDLTSAVRPQLFADAGKKVLNTLLQDKLDPAELEKVGAHLDDVISSGVVPKTSPLYTYSVNLKDLTDSMKSGKYTFEVGGQARYGNVFSDIAKDRMKARFAEMNLKYGQMEDVMRSARQGSMDLIKQSDQDIKQVKVSALKNFGFKLSDAKAKFAEEYNSILKSTKEETLGQIQAFKQEPLQAETAVEKVRELKKRDAAIAQTKQAFAKQVEKLNKYRDTQHAQFESTFRDEMAKEMEDGVFKVKRDLGNRTSELLMQHPLPGMTEKTASDFKNAQAWEAERNRYMGYQKVKATQKIRDLYEQEKTLFSQQAAKAKFIDIHHQMMEDFQNIHGHIDSQVAADLPKNFQPFYKMFRDEMDQLGLEEAQRGVRDTLTPNYMPRILSQHTKGKLLNFDPESFLSSMFNRASGTGMSRFTQERKMQDFASFKNFIEEHGGKVEENPLHLFFERYQASKAEQALHNVVQTLPEALRTGEAGRKMADYLQYVFRSGTKLNNPFSRKLSNWASSYSFYNKALLTVCSPAHYVKDILGYPFLAGQKGSMKNTFDFGSMSDAAAMKLKLQKGVERTTSAGKEFLDAHTFEQAAIANGLIGSSFSRASIAETVDHVANTYSKADLRHWITKAVHAGQEKDDLGRVYTAVSYWKEGMPLADAMKKAKSATYDFNDFNWIDRAASGLFAFYGFTRKNVPGVVRSLYENPGYHSQMSHLLDAFNYGKQPDEKDLALINDQNPNGEYNFRLFNDLGEGKFASQKWGFTPFENMWENVGDLPQGDINGWLRHIASQVGPDKKLALQMLATKYNLPWNNYKQSYQFLPREYSAMPNNMVEMLNKFSQTMGFGTVKRKDHIIYEMGRPLHEDGVFVPPKMMYLVSNLPTARIQKEALGIARADAHKNEYQKSIEQTLFEYISGVRGEVIDLPKMREKKKKRTFQQLIDLANAVGATYNPNPQIKKELLDKYKDLLQENKYNRMDE